MSNTRRHGGTGIGLAVCKRVVDLLNGDLSVRSSLNKGSSFTLKLHAGKCAEDSLVEYFKQDGFESRERADVKASDLSGTVLVVEDTQSLQMLYAKMLSKLGMEVITANNGQEAVEQVSQKNIDLIFMDISMPKMDGKEATSKIRDIENDTGHHVPIVALTAHALDGDEDFQRYHARRIQERSNGSTD